MNAMTEYKSYSDADKEALQQLRAEIKAQTGQEPKLAEMIAAVTPGMETPASMKGL